MENRHRILLGLGVEVFRSSRSEEDGTLSIFDRLKGRFGYFPYTLGADRGFFHENFLEQLLDRGIGPHVAPLKKRRSRSHRRARRYVRSEGYRLSQRARKKIEELFGEGKEYHGLRRFRRRTLIKVRQELHLIGWVLNLKRLAKILWPYPQPA
jgi:hypothetical protein